MTEPWKRSVTEPPALLKRRGSGSGLMSRRGNYLSVSLPEPPKSHRTALVEQGYLLGGVLGRSSDNRGFTVFALEKDGRRLAAKCTDERSADGIFAATLKGEFDILRSLSHPGLVRAEELVEATGGCAMVMELCAGVVLAHLLPQGSALGGPRRHGVLRALLGAVAYLHGQRVAHRDLHALNVLVDPRARESVTGEGAPAAGEVAVKVVDFGCALRLPTGTCQGATLEGDLNSSILPPDDDGSDEGCPLACDVFAVGLLAAGLAVGRPLKSADVIRRGAASVPAGFLALSPAGAQHVASMLCPRREARPSSGACRDSLPPVEGWLA